MKEDNTSKNTRAEKNYRYCQYRNYERLPQALRESSESGHLNEVHRRSSAAKKKKRRKRVRVVAAYLF